MNILSGFVEACRAYPERVALVQDGCPILYRDLLRRVQGFAAILNRHPCDDQPVAVAIDRGIDASIAIFAILHTGKCYLPLDLKNPPTRLQSITQDAGVSLVLGKGSRPAWVPPPATWVDIEKLGNPPDSNAPPVNVGAEFLACVLYTSGSTGKPKGVALSHRALVNFSRWAGQTFAIGTNDRIASLAPFHFDLSIFDLFTGLGSGASVHFVPGGLTLRPSRLTAWLHEHAITVWYTVPSLLNFLALKGAVETTGLKSLQTLLFAGEVMPAATLIKFASALPATRFYNLFGPTETNVCCYWPVERSRLADGEPIPIGKPACESELAVAEANGELLVRGDNLFSGYWNRGGWLNRVKPGSWYATGDRVSIGPDGLFRYHGRIDRMLKCSGYRVEPAEIESVVRNIPIVESCAVVGIDDPASGRRPAAAVVLQTGKGINDLLPAIKASLPAYMQPVKYVLLNRLPQLSNGKINYPEIERHLGKR